MPLNNLFIGLKTNNFYWTFYNVYTCPFTYIIYFKKIDVNYERRINEIVREFMMMMLFMAIRVEQIGRKLFTVLGKSDS